MNYSSVVSGTENDRPDLATRVFQNRAFELGWIIFLATFEMFVTFPVQRVLVVWWAYGLDAYYNHGVRVVPRKPLRFSTGALVPQNLEIITGVGLFLVTFFGLTFALFYALRSYDRWLRPRITAAGN